MERRQAGGDCQPFTLSPVPRLPRVGRYPIYEYVLRERLAQAVNAVLDSGDNITAIALEAGFASHSYFTGRFRRFFGCTPSALRRAAAAGQIGEFRKIMTARASGKA